MTHFKNPFKVIGGEIIAEEIQDETSFKNLPLNDRIKGLLGSSDLLLFMKGNAVSPQCGFSANTVQILNQFKHHYKTFDILKDPEIRQGLKEYSNWPTFPQLYIKGKLVGGNDIVTELFENGELDRMIKEL